MIWQEMLEQLVWVVVLLLTVQLVHLVPDVSGVPETMCAEIPQILA